MFPFTFYEFNLRIIKKQVMTRTTRHNTTPYFLKRIFSKFSEKNILTFILSLFSHW